MSFATLTLTYQSIALQKGTEYVKGIRLMTRIYMRRAAATLLMSLSNTTCSHSKCTVREAIISLQQSHRNLHDSSAPQRGHSHSAGSLYSCSTVARNPTARTCKTLPCHFDMQPPDFSRLLLHECAPLILGFLLIFDCQGILLQLIFGL